MADSSSGMVCSQCGKDRIALREIIDVTTEIEFDCTTQKYRKDPNGTRVDWNKKQTLKTTMTNQWNPVTGPPIVVYSITCLSCGHDWKASLEFA